MGQSAMEAYQRKEAAIVGRPYVYLAAVVSVVAIAVARTTFSSSDQQAGRQRGPRHVAGWQQTMSSLVRVGYRLRFGALAQCCYVGAQVSVWSFLIRYAQAVVPGTSAKNAANLITASLVLFALGRFSTSAALQAVKAWTPAEMLTACAGAAFLLCVLAATVLEGHLAIGAVCLVSAAMAPMYPTIFALNLAQADPGDRETTASVLVMMIVGGALVTPVLAAASDAAGIQTAYLVPAACFAVVAAYGRHAASRGVASASASMGGLGAGAVPPVAPMPLAGHGTGDSVRPIGQGAA